MITTPAEQQLPQLNIVREASVMRRIFEDAMPRQQIRDCAVLNVRYKPGKSCLVAYRLTMGRDGMAPDGMAPDGAAAPASQIVSARFYPPGSSLSRFVKAQRGKLAAPKFGEAIFHVPDLDAVVWAFPNDRKLPGVPALIDRDRVAREVAPLLASRAAGRRIGSGRVSLEVIRYIPEHGCTVRVTAHPDDGGSPMVFYGKAYSDESGEATWRNMSGLWDSARPAGALWDSARPEGTLRMAQPLLYEPAHLVLWQSAVEGPTLASLEASGPQFVALLQAAGRAVAALHRASAPGLKRLTADDLRAGLLEAELQLKRVRPLADRVSRLTALLLDQAPDSGARPLEPGHGAALQGATLHGDLHAKNIIFTGGCAALIDLDNLRTGDPLQDLGSFVASTCALGQETGAPDIAPRVAALVGAYEASVPWDVPRRALRWHTAAALMSEQAHRAVIRMKIACLEGLLEAAQQSLAGEGPMKALL